MTDDRMLESAQRLKEALKLARPGEVSINMFASMKSLGGSPTSLMFSSEGYFWSTIHSNIVVKLDQEGKILFKAGREGCAGFKDGKASDALFNFGFWLGGICEDHNTSSIVFSDPMNHVIRSLIGEYHSIVATLAGNCKNGYQDGQVSEASFSYPTGVAATSDGCIYICDSGNTCIRQLTNNRVSTLCGGPEVDFSSSAFLGMVTGLIYTPKGQLIVSDTLDHCLNRISPDRVVSIAGSTLPGYEDGSLDSALFSHPTGLHLTPCGDVLICDYYNHAIRAISDGEVVTLFKAPNGVYNFNDLYALPNTNLSSLNPKSVTLGPNGIVYIADAQGIVKVMIQPPIANSNSSPPPPPSLYIPDYCYQELIPVIDSLHAFQTPVQSKTVLKKLIKSLNLLLCKTGAFVADSSCNNNSSIIYETQIVMNCVLELTQMALNGSNLAGQLGLPILQRFKHSVQLLANLTRIRPTESASPSLSM